MKLLLKFVFVFCLATYSCVALGDPNSETRICEDAYCVFVNYDESLSAESTLLVETLRLRLCKHGVQIPIPEISFQPTEVPSVEPETELPASELPVGSDEKPSDDGEEEADAFGGCPVLPENSNGSNPVWWVVHLNSISSDKILMSVDYMEAQSGEDFICEFNRGPDAGATAWTLALSIEEVVLPYVVSTKATLPIGAGLAIIEPPAVAVPEKKDKNESHGLPKLRYLSAGVEVAYLGLSNSKMNDFIVGPRIGVQSLLGPRFVASFCAGWLGTAEVEDGIPENEDYVTGKVSHVPLDLLFGYILVDRTKINAILLGGVSAGFDIYKFDAPNKDEHVQFQYFDPWIQFRAEMSLYVYGPLSVYLNVGLAFPIIRDEVEDLDITVYSQDWMLPLFGMGVQLWNLNTK